MKKTLATATINNRIDTSRNNGLLSVSTPINYHASYTFDGIEVYDDIMDTIVFNRIHEKIARHCLNRLYSKGNMSAYEILTTGTAIIDIDDINSEVLLALYENKDCLEVADGQFRIVGDEAIKSVYGACSRFMYSFMQRHYKHAYCEIDGQTIDIFNVKSLASHADYSDIESMSIYQSFLSVVMSVYPKDYARIEKIVKMRIDGMTFTECANSLHVNPSTITRLQSKISECAKMLMNNDDKQADYKRICKLIGVDNTQGYYEGIKSHTMASDSKVYDNGYDMSKNDFYNVDMDSSYDVLEFIQSHIFGDGFIMTK